MMKQLILIFAFGLAGLQTFAQPALPSDSLYNLSSEWTTASRKKIHLTDLAGKIQVMAMIYTGCSAACPMIVEEMKSIANKISNNKRNQVGFVLVSMDPTTDTPAHLSAYAQSKGLSAPTWTLLTGPKPNVRELAAAIGLTYKKLDNGMYSHSNLILVLDRDGVIRHRQEKLGDSSATFKAIMTIR